MAPLQKPKFAIQAEQNQIQHFMHEHLLHKVYLTSEFNCDGCNVGGNGVRYQCSACEFDMHEPCATACYRVSSNLHPHHQLVLVNSPGDSRLCHVCKGVTNGLRYTCESQMCEFNVHTLCVQNSVSIQQQMQGTPTMTTIGSYKGVINSQPVMVNHQQQQQQFQGMIHTTQVGGYNGVNTSQPVMVNHQQQQLQGMIHTTQVGGYNGANTSQPVMVNHQQQQQGVPVTGFAGYNQQPMMVNHQYHQKQVVPNTTAYGTYQGVNNSNQNQMINQHQPQQQVMPIGYAGYNQQPVMANHQQQQQQVAFNTNQQQLMTNQHQQQGVGGYSVVNNNQTVMINHPQQPPPQQSSGFPNMGRIAANLLSTSIIGIPLFGSRN